MADMVRGISAVVRNLEKLGKDIEAGANKTPLRAGYELINEAIRIHEPHVKTSRLKGSLDAVKVGDIVEAGSGVKAGSEVEYAEIHEYQYPYLQPAVEMIRGRFPKMVIEDVKAEIKT